MEEIINIINEIKITKNRKLIMENLQNNKTKYLNKTKAELLQEINETKDVYKKRELNARLEKIENEINEEVKRIKRREQNKKNEKLKSLYKELDVEKLNLNKKVEESKKLIQKNKEEMYRIKNNRDILKTEKGLIKPEYQNAYIEMTKQILEKRNQNEELQKEIEELNTMIEALENKDFEEILKEANPQIVNLDDNTSREEQGENQTDKDGKIRNEEEIAWIERNHEKRYEEALQAGAAYNETKKAWADREAAEVAEEQATEEQAAEEIRAWDEEEDKKVEQIAAKQQIMDEEEAAWKAWNHEKRYEEALQAGVTYHDTKMAWADKEAEEAAEELEIEEQAAEEIKAWEEEEDRRQQEELNQNPISQKPGIGKGYIEQLDEEHGEGSLLEEAEVEEIVNAEKSDINNKITIGAHTVDVNVSGHKFTLDLDLTSEEEKESLNSLSYETIEKIHNSQKNVDGAVLRALLVDESLLNDYLDLCKLYSIRNDANSFSDRIVLSKKIKQLKLADIEYDFEDLRKDENLTIEQKMEKYAKAKETQKIFKYIGEKNRVNIKMSFADKVYFGWKGLTSKISKKALPPAKGGYIEIVEPEQVRENDVRKVYHFKPKTVNPNQVKNVQPRDNNQSR